MDKPRPGKTTFVIMVSPLPEPKSLTVSQTTPRNTQVWEKHRFPVCTGMLHLHIPASPVDRDDVTHQRHSAAQRCLGKQRPVEPVTTTMRSVAARFYGH
ncbi:hypothetical protein TREES_T100015100 [Tupaia chinensis]|uniref:Uncharacterized protein n=1 Tax=Tupaia chinensis TaxID=246437 RepID=L9KKC5_TUPCH|nr:hypothetical protein TREES_T100015100 [Tupaia chinensis]